MVKMTVRDKPGDLGAKEANFFFFLWAPNLLEKVDQPGMHCLVSAWKKACDEPKGQWGL